MAGIKFDFTGDNSGFIRTIEQIQASVKQTSKVLGEVGQYFDIDGIINQITSLTKVIRSKTS